MIPLNSQPYFECVELRRIAFFENSAKSEALINDEYEASGVHIAAMIGRTVVGYARFNRLPGQQGLLSQVLVAPQARGDRSVFKAILEAVLRLAVQEGCVAVVGNARERAVPLFKRAGFVPVGDPFPSPKTGIVHQSMILTLERATPA